VRHGLLLLYAVEVLVLLGAWLLAATGTRDFALAALALTAVAHLATMLTGDLMMRRSGRLKLTAAIAALLLAGLAVVGGWSLWQLGPVTLLCTVPAVADGLGPACDPPEEADPQDLQDDSVRPPPPV